MPITRTVPQPWKQPFSEHFSEFFGHIVWAWSIAAVSFYMIATHYSDVLSLF
jgi:putative membrane protein